MKWYEYFLAGIGFVNIFILPSGYVLGVIFLNIINFELLCSLCSLSLVLNFWVGFYYSNNAFLSWLSDEIEEIRYNWKCG